MSRPVKSDHHSYASKLAVPVKPSLNNAYEQVRRGGEHINELKILCADVCSAQAKAMVIHHQPQAITVQPLETAELFQVDVNKVQIPDRIPMLVGEASNAFRSALNYLVRQLARLDSKKTIRGTQFPIERTPSGFRGRSPVYLKGLNLKHVAAIKRLQPYRGCKWARLLARMSNVHKHDDLLIVSSGANMRIDHIAIPSTDGGPVRVAMQVKLAPALNVRIRYGRLPLIETLEVIQSQVTQTLDAFKPEFKG
jgi:hypothetical protein